MTDYRIYVLNMKEKAAFYGLGYLALAALGYIFYKSAVIAAIAGFAVIFFSKRYEEVLCEKRKEKLLLGFKDLLYSLSASVSAGRTIGEGLLEGLEGLKMIHGDNSPIYCEVAEICDGIFERMENDAVLLSSFAERSGLEDIRDFADVYSSVRRTGGDLDSVIQKTSNILLDKITIDREIRMVVSQKKLESKIIAAMPIAIIGGMNLTSSSYLEPMYETLEGRIIMTLAFAGIALSYVMISRITEIRV